MSETSRFQGLTLEQLERKASQQSLSDRAATALVDEAHQTETHKQQSTGHAQLIRGACEMAGTLAAGIAGAVAFGAGGKARLFGVARSLTLAAGAGSVVKYTVKSALEDVLLKPEERDVSRKDLIWGTVDGLSGAAGSLAESAVARRGLIAIGRKALGSEITESAAMTAGERVAAQSILPRFKLSLTRSLAGGATGTFVWSVPHRVSENLEEIKRNPLAGLKKTKTEVLDDTLFGTVLSAGLTAGGLGLVHSAKIARFGAARLAGDSGVTRLDLFHLNDLHSEIIGDHSLPRIVTKLDDLRSKSTSLGHPSQALNAGDLESGNVVFAYTRGGLIENEVAARAGFKIAVPGNHPYDVAEGGADVLRYQKVMQQVMADHPDLKLLAANLDLSAYPEYAKLVKPYTTLDVGPLGKTERVGVIGLVTEEGARGDIKYQDAATAAQKYIDELHLQGIKKILVLSHQGLAQDISLAQRVKGITAIIGGHSHDVEAIPRWVTQQSEPVSLWQRLNPFRSSRDPYAGWDVPIVQAGSNGHFLGELNLAMKANGAADRFRTTGRLHGITKVIPAERESEQFINSHLNGLDKLRKIDYNAEATAPFSDANIRNREVPLGDLISDAMAWGVRKNLGAESVDVALTHSGSVRSGIASHRPITRYELSNVFINTGNPAKEVKEMLVLPMTGKQLKDTLEFGVHDLAPRSAARKGPVAWLQRFFGVPQLTRDVTETGNFLQVSDDLRYSFDLSKKPSLPGANAPGRVGDVMLKGKTGVFEPIADDATYKVLTRFHEAEKWYKHGIFGKANSFSDAVVKLGGKPVKLSRVELAGEFVRGRTLSPGITGQRISDLTPKPWEPALHPGLSTISYGGVSAADKISDDEKKQDTR